MTEPAEPAPPPPPLPPPPPPPPEAVADVLYRIYCVREEMPKLEKLLARLTSGNPYNPPGGFVFPPGQGMRRLQDALGASSEYSVMGYGKEEAPDLWADLEAALPAQAKGFGEQDGLIARDAKLCVALRARIRNPETNQYVETLVHLADAFREMNLGIVWDVRMRKVFGHEEWRERVMEEPFSVLNHVSVATIEPAPGAAGTSNGGGARRVRTHGLRKFGSPDLLVEGVSADLAGEVGGLLRDFGEQLIQGDVLGPDETIDYEIGKMRTVPAPPIEAGEGDLLALVDEVEEGAEPISDPKAGMPKMLEALRARRAENEGKRAGGGRSAE